MSPTEPYPETDESNPYQYFNFYFMHKSVTLTENSGRLHVAPCCFQIPDRFGNEISELPKS
jgi:hypothetical protein